MGDLTRRGPEAQARRDKKQVRGVALPIRGLHDLQKDPMRFHRNPRIGSLREIRVKTIMAPFAKDMALAASGC